MTLLSEHMKSARQHQRRWLAGLLVFSLLMIMLSLSAGDRWLMPVDWFMPDNSLYVWQLRLPRTVAVLLVGASLAVAGAVMQALFENPLAEPGLLGVSNGAGVGLVLCILPVLPGSGKSACVPSSAHWWSRLSYSGFLVSIFLIAACYWRAWRWGSSAVR